MKLVVTLDVPEVDPTLVDPEEIAEGVLYRYERDRVPTEEPEVKLLTAEWE